MIVKVSPFLGDMLTEWAKQIWDINAENSCLKKILPKVLVGLGLRGKEAKKWFYNF